MIIHFAIRAALILFFSTNIQIWFKGQQGFFVVTFSKCSSGIKIKCLRKSDQIWVIRGWHRNRTAFVSKRGTVSVKISAEIFSDCSGSYLILLKIKVE